MNTSSIQGIVNAVLYEGYLLYPYRASSVKNRQRWTFGGVFPQAYSVAHGGAEPWLIQTECLVQGGPATLLSATPGFLHLVERVPGALAAPLPDWPQPEPAFRAVEVLTLADQSYFAWQEAVEGQVAPTAMAVADGQRSFPFVLAGRRDVEALRNADGAVAGVLVRTRCRLEGALELRAESVGADLFRITARLMNRTPFTDAAGSDRAAAALRALVSCHLVLRVAGGRFLSSIDPPAACAALAAGCENIGVWPVLAGAPGSSDTMLAAPIILYDYPQVAPESPGDLFDGTEIDEILTLRILTLTEQEKREMASVDQRARALLERSEHLTPQQLQQMHGSMHGSAGSPWEALDDHPPLDCVAVAGALLRVGDRVRLRPRARADIFDLALAGKVAVIEALERDFEARVHIAVTLLDDPGRDLGLARMPGHRFFFGVDEIEPLAAPEDAA